MAAQASKEYKVTKITADDFTEWSALFRAYVDFYESSIPEEQYRKTFERILDTNTDLEAILAREGAKGDGRLIGFAHFFPMQSPWTESNALFLHDLFVDPSFRGGGVGRKLILDVAQIARDKGCNRVKWVTKHDNTTARRLYDTLAQTAFTEYRMNLS